MEISKLLVRDLNDLSKNHGSVSKLSSNLIGDVAYDIIDRVQTLKNCEKSSPNGVVSVLVKYSSDGLEKEPTDEQRQYLSALSKIHNNIMSKVKSNDSLEDVVYYAGLAKIVHEMIEEVKNELK